MKFMKATSTFFWPAFVCAYAWNLASALYELVESLGMLLFSYIA